MTHGSLFSGIGGFDEAAKWMGWQNVFHCEWSPFGQRVLKYHFPESISYDDITKTDFSIHRGRIDVLSGGFPCQPYSTAGKRLGKEDSRHLWPEMLRAVREIQPRWVVGENVRGIISWSEGLVFDEVHSDLEAEGYSVRAFVLPAAGVNAPHRRDRVWFVAYAKSARAGENIGRIRSVPERCDKWKENESLAADTNERSAGPSGKSGSTQGIGSDNNDESGKWGGKTQQHIRCVDVSWDAAYTGNEGLQRSQIIGGTGGIGQNGKKFPSGCIPPNWEKFPTESPICSRNDGIPDRLDGITFSKWRNESIKAYGNAVVPQVVLPIFRSIQQFDSL